MNELLNNCKNSDDNDEISLRPQKLNEYIGQENLKNNLRVFIGAAKKRNETLDHVLFYGPPGLGKTTLANIIANEMNSKIIYVNGPSIEKSGDIASILTNLEPGDILFIDEIHRLPKVVEEILYPAMEDFKLLITIPRDTGSSTLNIDLPPFTLIGATTRIGDLSSPLRARFGIIEKINYYSIEELTTIVIRTARVFNISIDNKSAKEIASRSRGTPRIANRLFRRVRDFAEYNETNSISYKDCIKALKLLGIDEKGLDNVDMNYLLTLATRFNGGPVGLDTLTSSIGEENHNIEDVYEPYLIKNGFIDKTPRGRILTKKGYEHLKKYHKFDLKS